MGSSELFSRFLRRRWCRWEEGQKGLVKIPFEIASLQLSISFSTPNRRAFFMPLYLDEGLPVRINSRFDGKRRIVCARLFFRFACSSIIRVCLLKSWPFDCQCVSCLGWPYRTAVAKTKTRTKKTKPFRRMNLPSKTKPTS